MSLVQATNLQSSVATISTAFLASSTLIITFKQKCFHHFWFNWTKLAFVAASDRRIAIGTNSRKETILVVPVFMTVLLTTIAYGFSRRIQIGSAMPILLAGILSLLMIVVVAYVVRGDAYERVINSGTLSLSDAVGAEMNVFSMKIRMNGVL